MADHPKYYSGGTKRHSSKDSKTTTHDIEIEGSHSTEQKTSLSRFVLILMLKCFCFVDVRPGLQE